MATCDRCGNDNLPTRPIERPAVSAFRDGIRQYTTETSQLCLTCVRSFGVWWFSGKPAVSNIHQEV